MSDSHNFHTPLLLIRSLPCLSLTMPAASFEEQEPPGNRSFSEIIASISDVKFSHRCPSADLRLSFTMPF
ncbi:unnamed protein product [Closterium sp. NIES-54]